MLLHGKTDKQVDKHIKNKTWTLLHVRKPIRASHVCVFTVVNLTTTNMKRSTAQSLHC